jgi:hypothetical protein
MRRLVVLSSLALSFLAPLVLPAAQASQPNAVGAAASDTSCRRRRAKKQPTEGKKKKDKDGKKPYGFEL